MDKIITRESIKTINKKGINLLLDKNDKPVKNKPWLGDLFSFLYDSIMKKSVFPKKFNASYEKHYEILEEIFEQVKGKTIIEFATGSGDASRFLDNNNIYAGIDISTGLLRLARKKFDRNGYSGFELFSADASETPFQADIFDTAICNLSLNFFEDIGTFITELERLLRSGGIFYCSVPVPERKKSKATIHGSLYSATDLKRLFENNNFTFNPYQYENGALLYFKAILNKQ